MSVALAPPLTDKLAGARAFARSLNILLKHVRLYGMNHKRSSDQFDQAWALLRSILTAQSGFLLGISGNKLLLDGVPLESGPSEQTFAKMLASAGISSIHFADSITTADFRNVLSAFAASRPSELLNNLQTAANDSPRKGLRVNEVRFVAHDGASGDPGTVAGSISAKTISELGPQVTDWIKDPKKLLQLISAAEGMHGGHGDGPGGPGTGTGTGSGIGTGSGSEPGTGSGSGAGELKLDVMPAYEQHTAPLQEDEVVSVIRFMARMGKLKGSGDEPPKVEAVQQELTELNGNAHSVLYQMLFHTAASSFEGETPDLLKLAEHLAIRFAIESYQRGDVKYNSIQQMIERLNNELGTLRKVLDAHEDRMTRAGMVVESKSEILDKQFWASVPDWGKKNILLSEDGWCIPPKNIRSYVEQLSERRERETPVEILTKYLAAIESPEMEARRKVATGIADLADFYGQLDPGLLQQAILRVGRQLAKEQSLEMQTLLGATFVRLNQEAALRRDYQAVEQSLCSLVRIEKSLPALARDMKPRVSVQSRLHDFVSEVHQLDALPDGLVEVLRRTPGPAAEEIAMQFARCSTRPEAERFVDLMKQVGDSGLQHLRELLVNRPSAEGVIGVGLLTRFDPELLLNELPQKMPTWSRPQQDSAVRQISSSGSKHRGELLMTMLDQFDSLIVPEAIDEIGLTGDPGPAAPLLELAEGKHAGGTSPYVQLKAVEAIGRLRIAGAESMLTDLLMQRGVFGFTHPRELRVAAMQALQEINPEHAAVLLPKSGLEEAELNIRPLMADDTNWLRQRRYERVTPNATITATAITPKGKCQVALERISLGGGLAVRNGRGQFGTEAMLELNTGFRQVKSRVIIRESNGAWMFEIADIGLEERGRLRKLIAAQMK